MNIGEFKPADGITLVEAPNGGWVVSTRSLHLGESPQVIGAYSCANDMLRALSNALIPLQPVADGGMPQPWIPHDGTECPVSDVAKVEYRLADGFVGVRRAGGLDWSFGAESHRVVAYKVLPEHEGLTDGE